MSTKHFGDVERDLRTKRLDFDGDPGYDPDPGFLNPYQDPYSGSVFEVKRSNVKVGVSLHSCECQSSSYCDQQSVPFYIQSRSAAASAYQRAMAILR